MYIAKLFYHPIIIIEIITAFFSGVIIIISYIFILWLQYKKEIKGKAFKEKIKILFYNADYESQEKEILKFLKNNKINTKENLKMLIQYLEYKTIFTDKSNTFEQVFLAIIGAIITKELGIVILVIFIIVKFLIRMLITKNNYQGLIDKLLYIEMHYKEYKIKLYWH